MNAEREFPCDCHDADEAHDESTRAAAKYWASYFGLDKAKTPAERQSLIEAFRPVSAGDDCPRWEN